jgi:hypothetical protein
VLVCEHIKGLKQEQSKKTKKRVRQKRQKKFFFYVKLKLYFVKLLNKRMSSMNQITYYEDTWKRCMAIGGENPSMTQDQFFKKYIPVGEDDFAHVFDKFNLGEVFISEKVVTNMLGNFNCNFLFRQVVSEVPHLLVYSNDNYMAFQPLGEPGRDINNLKIGHLIVVNYNQDNRFTLSEMLPLSKEEKDDLKDRSDFLKMAYSALFKNMLVKDCGSRVLKKALDAGLTPETPIREFFSYQIMNIPKGIKSGRPGYKLMVNGSEISNDRQKVNSEIARVFNQRLKIGNYIQGPRYCSQLISHIHGFLFYRKEETFNNEFYKTYINLDDILSISSIVVSTPPRPKALSSPRVDPIDLGKAHKKQKNSFSCCVKPH